MGGEIKGLDFLDLRVERLNERAMANLLWVWISKGPKWKFFFFILYNGPSLWSLELFFKFT